MLQGFPAIEMLVIDLKLKRLAFKKKLALINELVL